MKPILEEILTQKNAGRLTALCASDLAAICISLVYGRFPKYERLNHAQRVLYLCMRLEDACQADTILSLSEEKELFLRLPEMCRAYEEIGAAKTAALIRQLIQLLPEETFVCATPPEWSWFFEDEERHQKMMEIDGQICNYPDGVMQEWYFLYVSRPGIAEKLLENI